MGDSGPVTKQDLYHHGVIGWLKARQNYKEEKQVPLNAYAAIRIKGEIMDALRKSPLIRLPQEKQGKVKQLAEAKKMLQDKGISPDPAQVSKTLGWDENQVFEAESLSASVVSADQTTEKGHLVVLPDPGDSEQSLLNKDLARALQWCLEQIDEETDRLIFIAREQQGMTLKQLAERFKFSIETARQKNISAKESMKQCMKKNGWGLN